MRKIGFVGAFDKTDMKSGYPVLTFTAGEGFPGLFVQ